MLDLVKITLLFGISGFSHSITVTTPERVVNVTEGGTVVLLCTFTTTAQTTNLVVEWSFSGVREGGQPNQVLYNQAGATVIGQKFTGRVKLLSDPKQSKNASISISNMQQADTGLYTCMVNNVPDVEGANEKSIKANVLVKPSAPFCASHGEVEMGHRVTLTCHSEKGNPPPTYTWTHLQHSTISGVQDIHAGTLSIQNISEVQFGHYRCVASNSVGSAACDIDLSEEEQAGIIVGAIIGALLGCAVVALLVWFVTHQLRKRTMKVTKTNVASEMQPMKASAQLEAAEAGKEAADENPSA